MSRLNYFNPNKLVVPILVVMLVMAITATVLGNAALQKADQIAIEKQGDVIVRAIAAHAEQLGRQGIPQVFWQEAAEKVRARDLAWMDENYGPYLQQVLGYKESYVLDGANRPIFAAANGLRVAPDRYRSIEADVTRLVDLVRSTNVDIDETGLTSEIKWSTRTGPISLVVAARPALVRGKPSFATVSTIIPDLDPAGLGEERPYLLIGVADIDDAVLARVSRDYRFADLKWDSPGNNDQAQRMLVDDVGSPIGTLSWIPERPAAEFLARLAPTLSLAFAVLLLTAWAAVMATRSLSKARVSVEALGYDASHDALTGLANRRHFSETIATAVQRYRRGGATISLLSVDLDHFKELNDGCGHAAGDEALRIVADRIREVTGEGGFVARVGGDEFEIILEGKPAGEVETLSSRIIERVNHPLRLTTGIEWRLGCSIGIACCDGGDAEDLMRKADLAMSAAKAMGRNCLQVFHESMDERLKERISIERLLRAAIERGQLSIDYQPVLETRTGDIVGAEALIRWRQPVLGLIAPDRFLPVAETTGLISEIDQFVLNRACEEAACWSSGTVSVNMSVNRVLKADIVDQVRKVLESTGLAPHRLELEITERAILIDHDRARQTFEGLRALGIGVVLDNVGIGYSSLSHLREMPFSKVKIDSSLARDIGSKPEANEIVYGLVRISKALGMKVAATGVETHAQREFLEAAGCDALQGFCISKPLPASDLEALLSKPRLHIAARA